MISIPVQHHVVSEALPIINAMRIQRGNPPLTVMPKGIKGDAHRCVLCRALDCEAVVPDGAPSVNQPYLRWVENGQPVPLPPQLNAFALAFDGGKLPELEEEASNGLLVACG